MTAIVASSLHVCSMVFGLLQTMFRREDIDEPTQLELFYMLLHLVGRKSPRAEPVMSKGSQYADVSLQEHVYRQERVPHMQRLEAIIEAAQAALSDIEFSERLQSEGTKSILRLCCASKRTDAGDLMLSCYSNDVSSCRATARQLAI